MVSKYKKIWDDLLKVKKLPNRCSGVIEISYKKFKSLSDKFNDDTAKEFVSNFLDGKVIIVKKAFPEKFVREIKSKVKKYWIENPETFHEMREDCPDFHRIITPEKAKNYAVGAVRHTTYFFPWNNDPCKFNERIYERWRYSKYISGLNFREFEKNTPKNGSIDRIQIVCYPPRFGGVETHVDTTSNSLLAISCYLSSKKNKNFSTGGFYCLGDNNKNIDIEKYISLGDMSLFCPTIEHGVSRIDKDHPKKKYNWNSGIGRWWMGLFTNDSNMKKKRKTSKSLEKYHSERVGKVKVVKKSNDKKLRLR
jgi:hypothetical protein